jgi:hypothetical protein
VGFDAANPNARPVLVVDASGAFIVWPTTGGVLASHCKIDGTGCAFVDIGAKSGIPSARDPRAAFDAANQKLLVVVRNAGDSDKPYLIRCSTDLASCTSVDISAGQGAGKLPAIAVDAKNGKVLVVTSHAGEALLLSCALDGTACFALPMKPSAHDVGAASLAIDEVGQRLFAAWNEDAGSKMVLFHVGLW